MTEKDLAKRTLLAPPMTDKDREEKALVNYYARKAMDITRKELEKQYRSPLDEYIIYEEEPLSDKQIEALSHLMRANKPFNATNWTMLFMGILYVIFVVYLLLI